MVRFAPSSWGVDGERSVVHDPDATGGGEGGNVASRSPARRTESTAKGTREARNLVTRPPKVEDGGDLLVPPPPSER